VKPALRTIPFVKASACGNDFLLIDTSVAPPDIEAFTRRICDRHTGVGADGVEWMSPHFSVDVEIKLINADGSHAEISGNGTRCVAAYVCATEEKERVTILTGAGTKVCLLTARRDSEYEFETELGKPTIDPEFVIQVPSGTFRGVPVMMGNPHCVIFVDEFTGDWQAQAAEIQGLPQFPHGVNVEFVRVDSKFDIRVRFFERGAGETQSSGTGSSASAAAAMSLGRATSPVKVHAPGGTQIVRRVGDNIFLRGPARLLCRGEFFLS
jgi:diaminopimelate epimerase